MAQLRFTYIDVQSDPAVLADDPSWEDGVISSENLDFQHYERAKAAFIAHLNFAQNERADLDVTRNERGETIAFTHDSQTVEGRRIKVELVK